MCLTLCSLAICSKPGRVAQSFSTRTSTVCVDYVVCVCVCVYVCVCMCVCVCVCAGGSLRGWRRGSIARNDIVFDFEAHTSCRCPIFLCNYYNMSMFTVALELVPNSIEIWRTVIDLEKNENDARIMLSRAVECVPSSVDMWLALASLETYQNAQRVLNNARAQLPQDHRIWIAAAKLEEAQGNDKMIDRILTKGTCSVFGSCSPLIVVRYQYFHLTTDKIRLCPDGRLLLRVRSSRRSYGRIS